MVDAFDRVAATHAGGPRPTPPLYLGLMAVHLRPRITVGQKEIIFEAFLMRVPDLLNVRFPVVVDEIRLADDFLDVPSRRLLVAGSRPR